MKSLYKGIGFCIFCTGFFIAFTHRSQTFNNIPIDLPYMPGQILANANCWHVDENISLCSVYANDHHYEIDKQTSDNKIIRVTYYLDSPLKIGNLLAIYGTPTDVISLNYLKEIGFNHLYFWTVTHPFTPDSKVIFVSYLLTIPDHKTAWRGFVND